MTIPLEQVTAHRVWAIYADFDGAAPDSYPIAYVATEALAIEIVRVLSHARPNNQISWKDRVWDLSLPFIADYMWHRSFAYIRTVLEDPSNVVDSVDKFMTGIAELADVPAHAPPECLDPAIFNAWWIAKQKGFR